jgi:N-acetylglucosamine-6-sulfatase
MNRRDFLKMSGTVVSTLSVGGCLMTSRNGEKKKTPPNIVFIMTDDHAPHALSCYGSRLHTTPNLDRIAQAGMRFNHCFCTNAICAPSRAVILSGQYSHINGKRTNAHEEVFNDSRIYPKLLQQAGYETAMIGKWHLVSEPTGFDYWEILPDQGSYYNPDFIQQDGSVKRYEGYCPDLITDLSIDWLERGRDQSKPFLLISQHKAPHRCWSPAARHLGLYKHGTIPEPDTLFQTPSGSSPASRSEMSLRHHFSWSHDMKFKCKNLFPDYFTSSTIHQEYRRMTDEQRRQWDAYYEPENQAFIEQMNAGALSEDDILRWKYQRYMHDYLGAVAAVDEGVGRLLDYLDEKGLSDNTIVVYTSDQGFYLGDRGWYDKRFMYEESLRMPLLVRWPTVVRPGSVCDDIVLNLDFAETFLDTAGVAIPAEMQGESMVSLLKGKSPSSWRDAMYYHYYEYPAVHMVPRHYGIRTKRYKLIHFYHDIDCWELYDLHKDPGEQVNVYEDPAYADTVTELKAALRELQAAYKDSEGLALSSPTGT